jgi:hypothetical protein
VVSLSKPISLDDGERVVDNSPFHLSVIYDTEEEVGAREGMRTRSSKSNVREHEVARQREGMKTRSNHKNVREQEEVAEDDEEANSGEQDDQDADFKMHDSDYEINDDDDLFASHVDEDEGEVKKRSVHGK